MGIGEGMVRISIGVEHPEDIISDIEQAMAKVAIPAEAEV
jgi:methionine-gamma-lyase